MLRWFVTMHIVCSYRRHACYEDRIKVVFYLYSLIFYLRMFGIEVIQK